jgi:hypothetical protein
MRNLDGWKGRQPPDRLRILYIKKDKWINTRSKPKCVQCSCSVQNHQSSSSPTCGRHIFCQSEAGCSLKPAKRIQKIVNSLDGFSTIKRCT